MDQLLPKALSLHKQDPAHGGNVGHADTEMTEHYLHVLQHRHPDGAYPRTAADAVLSDARRTCPAKAVGGGYRKAETADRCRVCRTGISPGLTFAARGRRTEALLQWDSVWYTELDNSEFSQEAIKI